MGVVGQEFLPQAGAVEMNVDFGGLERFVAEQFLNHPQRGSPFEEMGGEAMAQRMRRYGLQYSGCGRKVAYDVEYHYPRHLASAAVEKENVLRVGLYVEVGPLRKILLDEGDGHWRDRHDPLFAALALHYKMLFS